MGSSKKQTVGYKYYLGMHMILCHGPIDFIRYITVDKRNAWSGNSTGGQISIAAEGLFGGEEREGGVSGLVDIEMGRNDQGRNSYLLSKLGPDVPTFRKVVGMVLRQCYLGLNPYLKTWGFRGQRIHVRQDGLAQWYDAKAEITARVLGLTDTWKYKTEPPGSSANYSSPSYDDSAWAEGPGGFGNYAPGFNTPPANTIIFGGVVPTTAGNIVWIRKDLGPIANGPLFVEAWHDDGCEIWFNGTKLTIQEESYFHSVTAVPGEIISGTGSNVVVCKVTDSFKNGAPSGSPTYIYAGLQMIGQADMNPAHIIRECLTDPDWGMGYAEADVDDDAFEYAADLLYDENMGISILWDRQTPIEDFINEIVKHISASLYVDRATGKFVLKLIRDDYDKDDLLVLDESHIQKVEGATRPTAGELVNSVTAVYWNASTGENGSVTVQDQALIQMQGAVVNTTLQYPGFTNSVITSKAALRALVSLSTPLLSCTVYADRTAASLNIGDVFRMQWPDLEVNDVVMRVTGLALGDGRSNVVKLTVVEDVFSFPEVATVVVGGPPGTDPSDPSAPARAAEVRAAMEMPYYEAVQQQGQATVDSTLSAGPDAGYVMAACARPGAELTAVMQTDPGTGFEDANVFDFCPGATLSAPVAQADTTLHVVDGVDLDLVELGTYAAVGPELVRIDAIDEGAGTVTVGRGVLDTVPVAHAAGEYVVFLDQDNAADPTEYASGEQVDVRLLPSSGSGRVPEGDAYVDTVELAGRAFRPYPPGKVQVNGEYFPAVVTGDLAFTWAHRDRLQQTSGTLYDFTAGDIGPEVGVTYTARVYNEYGGLIHSEAGMSGTAWTYTNDQEVLDNGGTSGDAHWSSVKSLLHLDSTWADASGRTWTPANGASISSTKSKFGGASAYFSGASQYAETPASADFAFGTGDFTVECWVNADSMPVSTYYSPIGNWASSQGWCLFLRPSGGLQWQANGLSLWVISSAIAFVGNWVHLAYSRQGSTGRLFADGVLVASGTDTQNVSLLQPVRIGANRAAADWWRGYVDDVRITKGVARYTAAFTPPAMAFPDGPPTARLNGRLTVQLAAVRDGRESYQHHVLTMRRRGYGFNYGESYGN